jgi:hypothetical protein
MPTSREDGPGAGKVSVEADGVPQGPDARVLPAELPEAGDPHGGRRGRGRQMWR